MQYRCLIIGNPFSVWTREYVREIHIRHHDQVSITMFDAHRDPLYMQAYEEMGVSLIPIGKGSGAAEKFKKLFRLLHLAYSSRRNKAYDLVEIHYPPHSLQAYVLALFLKIIRVPSLVVFWGSDILTITRKEAERLAKVLSAATAINRMSKHTYEAFSSFYGHKYDARILPRQLGFGTLALPYIRRLMEKSSRAECKAEYGIAEDTLCVAIGYNGRRRQQHIAVMRELSRLPQQSRDRLHLLLHLSGGDDPAYKDEVAQELAHSGLQGTIVAETLDFDAISHMRCATDVFIHAQPTDGLSGSMRECLYAGSIVVNPSWIHYDELLALGIEYVQYDDFSQLNGIMEGILSGELRVDTDRNRELISSQYSWECMYSDWIEAFDALIGKRE